MGGGLREVLEEGVRVAYGPEPALAGFVSRHHVSPSLAQLLSALRSMFPSAADALAWLDRRVAALGSTPFDMIAKGEAARVVCALSLRGTVRPRANHDVARRDVMVLRSTR